MANTNYVKFAKLGSITNAKSISEDSKNVDTIIFAGTGNTDKSVDGEIWLGGRRFGSSTNNNNPSGETKITLTPTTTVGYITPDTTINDKTASEILKTMLMQKSDAVYNKATMTLSKYTINRFVGETIGANKKSFGTVTVTAPSITSGNTTINAGATSYELSYPTGISSTTTANSVETYTLTMYGTWSKGNGEVKNNVGEPITTNNDIQIYCDNKAINSKSDVIEEYTPTGESHSIYVIKGSNANTTANLSTRLSADVDVCFWYKYRYFISDNAGITTITTGTQTNELPDADAAKCPANAFNITVSNEAVGKHLYILVPSDNLGQNDVCKLQTYNAMNGKYESSNAMSAVKVGNNIVTVAIGSDGKVVKNGGVSYQLYEIDGALASYNFKLTI